MDRERCSPSDGFDFGDKPRIKERIRDPAISRPNIERENELSGRSLIGRSQDTHPGRTDQESLFYRARGAHYILRGVDQVSLLSSTCRPIARNFSLLPMVSTYLD